MTQLEESVGKCAQLSLGALEVLRPWVEQNSYTTNISGVNAVADLLIADFKMDGLSVTRHPGRDVADHLVFTTDAWADADPAERLVLVGHHDTVFPPGSFDVWKIDGDRLNGPGVLDMKGGLVTVHTALHTLASLGALATLPLAFLSVGDEEIGSPESQELLRATAAGAAAGLVFEAGRAHDAIITSRKGTGGFDVVVKGRAAHAGNHHAEGISAIHVIAKLVDAMEACTDYDKGLTVNVGTISGGQTRNTVPDHAECLVDCRYIHREDGLALMAKIKEIAASIATDSKAEIVLSGGIKRAPLEPSPHALELFEHYAKAASDAGLGNSEAALIGGGSDANTLCSIGVPSIDGLGPRGRGFHTLDEHIEISSLALRAEALVRFLIEWSPNVHVG